MKKYIAVLTALVMCLLLFAGCGCDHDWEKATCEAPMTCSKCGETEGEVAEHRWKDATCEAPKTCRKCGETEGDVAEHTWKDATCEAPKTCRRCGETEGKASEHVDGDVEITGKDYVHSTYTFDVICSVCNGVSYSSEKDLTFLSADGVFFFSANELVERFAYLCEKEESDLTAEACVNSHMDNKFTCDFYSADDIMSGYIFFYEGDNALIDSDADTQYKITDMHAGIEFSDKERQNLGGQLMLLIPMAADPQLELEDAMDLVYELIENGSAVHNDISYLYNYDLDSERIIISVYASEEAL